MNVNKPAKWLNSAYLGTNSLSEPLTIKDAAINLTHTFGSLRAWALEWSQFFGGNIAFVDSTTAACDAALLALAAKTHSCIYLYTSSAHLTIRQSVHSVARVIDSVRKSSALVGEIDLRNLNFTSSSDVANVICERIASVAGSLPAIVVLEHVTYDNGLRLPIDQISEYLASRYPNVKIVIDGAQATGLWRPQSSNISAYLGCFHKFVCGPVATSFLVIDETLVEYLPSHVSVTVDVPEALCAGLLPTLDLEKWSLAAEVVHNHFSLIDLGRRLRNVEKFNSAPDVALVPFAISLGENHDPDLRSHISSLKFDSVHSAKFAVDILRQEGFAVQQISNLVRITAGIKTNHRWGKDVGIVAKRLLEH